MRGIIPIIIGAAGMMMLGACTEQRDLYLTASPMLEVKGDWEASLGVTDMSQNATACAYYADNSEFVTKGYFTTPNSTTLALGRGNYDVLLFNGMMYDEDDTHLDKIFFRGTDVLSTFEAVVKEGEANRRLVRAEGEYIASNEMETLTSMCTRHEIEGDVNFVLKYDNGRNGNAVATDYIDSEVYMTPVAVSYNCQVIVNLIYPNSAYSVSGALKGFAGSVFMESRMPSAMDATHQFILNNKQIDAGSDPLTGTIQSPVFVTFGPPLDQPDRKYTIELSIMLVNGQQHEVAPIDITDQIEPVIEKIRENLNATEPIGVDLTIPIEISIELPDVKPISGQIGVGDWDEDEIITVPINKP